MEQLNNWKDTFIYIKENKLIDIIIAIAIIILSIMMSSFISAIIIKVFKLKEKDQVKLKTHPLYKSIKAIFLFLGLYLALFALQLPEDAFNVCDTALRILIIWNIARTVANLIAPDSKLMKKIKESDKIDEDDTFVKIISRFGKIRSICNCSIYNHIRIKLRYKQSCYRTWINKRCYSACSTRLSRKLT